MRNYEKFIEYEVKRFKAKNLKKPTLFNKVSKTTQNKFNGILPDKFHEVMTSTIKTLVKSVLVGSEITNKEPILALSLEERETLVKDKIESYKKTAMIEGMATGAGGFIVGLADFPMLLSIKMKFLFEVAAIYGFDTKDYTERLFILQIFQLTYSSRERTLDVFKTIDNWEAYKTHLPTDINQFNWREFQQEYRDYLDIAKLLQLMPIIGAPIGAYTNYKLLDKLGEFSMNCYRIRILKEK